MHKIALVIILAAAHAGSVALDASSTRQIERRGYVEVNPATRALLGPRPTWAGLATVGVVDVSATAYVAARMRASNNPVARRLWWLPQALQIGARVGSAAHNYALPEPRR